MVIQNKERLKKDVSFLFWSVRNFSHENIDLNNIATKTFFWILFHLTFFFTVKYVYLTKKKLILARDPFGIKPLYYSNKNGVFYFASQVKSLLTIEDISKKKSNAGVVSYYLWGNISEPMTLYQDIKSVEKGQYKIIHEDGREENYVYANLKETIL